MGVEPPERRGPLGSKKALQAHCAAEFLQYKINTPVMGVAAQIEHYIKSFLDAGEERGRPNLPIEESSGMLSAIEAPECGVLQENTGLQFALYSPQPYTPLQSWNCPGCNTNASLSDYVAHPAFPSLLVTLVVMFLSGYQLLRNTGH
ncbi:hypothetical protein BC835DRAFT_1527998 [Cytidiella melzeri]|nr:hypothetical protein BC835DRAFT_1527998 [Cytidiella melzeri]